MAGLLDRWQAWDRKNPAFYELFKRFTFEALGHGHTKLSAWLIVNRLRWESAIVTRGETYKVPNDFIALYARLFMLEFPEHVGLFETRPMKRHVPVETRLPPARHRARPLQRVATETS